MEDTQDNTLVELDNFDDFLQSEDNELIIIYSQHIDLIKKNSERIKKVSCKYDLPILEYEKALRLIDQYKRNYEEYFSSIIGDYAVNLNKFDNVKAVFDERNEELKKAKKMFKRCKKIINGTIEKIKKQEEATSKEEKKGFDLGLDKPQLDSLHNALIEQKLLVKCEFKHFENAFNNEVLAEDFKQLKWRVQYYASIFVRHYIEHDTPWKIATQVFDNGTIDSLKNAYNPKSSVLSDNQKNAKELLDKIFKSLP